MPSSMKFKSPITKLIVFSPFVSYVQRDYVFFGSSVPEMQQNVLNVIPTFQGTKVVQVVDLVK